MAILIYHLSQACMYSMKIYIDIYNNINMQYQ